MHKQDPTLLESLANSSSGCHNVQMLGTISAQVLRYVKRLHDGGSMDSREV